jgi:hypothetical protein
MLPNVGEGKDGMVWSTNRRSAVKFHFQEESYRIERDAYIRLRDCDATRIAGVALPELHEYDDVLLAIEMTVVAPPYCVDFASAIFDNPPDFNEDEGHTFEDFIRDRFDERADEALAFYYELAQRTGIYLPDLHRDNLKF